jgi:hypothetical protein
MTTTTATLTNSQRKIMLILSAGPKTFGGIKSKPIEALQERGLLKANYDIEADALRGRHRIKWHCSITEDGLVVLASSEVPENAFHIGQRVRFANWDERMNFNLKSFVGCNGTVCDLLGKRCRVRFDIGRSSWWIAAVRLEAVEGWVA